MTDRLAEIAQLAACDCGYAERDSEGHATNWCNACTPASAAIRDLLALVHSQSEQIARLEGERDAAQRELTDLNKALTEREQWRAGKFGVCVICGATIWHTDCCIEDERGVMHPLCPILKRAEAAEQRLARLEGALRSIANSSCCGTCQEAALVAKCALAATPEAT